MEDEKKYGKLGDDLWKPENTVDYDGRKWLKMPGHYPHTEMKFQMRLNMKCRDSDVFLCSYPKSGTNWVHEVISMILTQSTEYNSFNTLDNLLEIQPDLSKINNLESPRFLFSHLPYQYLPVELRKGTGKIVYVQRNPKDLAVSVYAYLRGKAFSEDTTWNEALEILFFRKELQQAGYWFDYVKEWEKELNKPNVLQLSYEELKIDLKLNVRKIAIFLEQPCTDEFAGAVAEKCSFKNLKENRRDNTAPLTPGFVSTLYRKGEVGDWKKWFTVSQNERFDELIDKEMKDSKLKYIYEL